MIQSINIYEEKLTFPEMHCYYHDIIIYLIRMYLILTTNTYFINYILFIKYLIKC